MSEPYYSQSAQCLRLSERFFILCFFSLGSGYVVSTSEKVSFFYFSFFLFFCSVLPIMANKDEYKMIDCKDSSPK